MIAMMVAAQAQAATLITSSFVLPDKSLNYININVGRNQLAGFSAEARAIGEWCTNFVPREGSSVRCEGEGSAYKAGSCDMLGCTSAFSFPGHWLEIPTMRFDDDALQLRFASFLGWKQNEPPVWWEYSLGPTKVTVELRLKDGVNPASVNMGLQFIRTMPAVPEPHSWALLITGFGAVGLAARSRRRIAALPPIA